MIPTNRVGTWLDLAVDSVLSEDLVGLRLIVVFDGIEVPDDLSWLDDPRVEIVHEPVGRGPSAAMTTSLARARTPFVARLDSDDVDLPGRLQRQAEYLEAHPDTVAVSSRTERIDEHGRGTGLVSLPAGDDIRRHLLLSNVVPHSTLTFRRDVALDVGGYREEFRQMEDYDFILRLAERGPIAQLEAPLVQYRVHSQQTSRGASPRGPHIAAVREGRRRLAAVLGVNRTRAALEHLAWTVVQHLRWSGVVRPGHER